MIDLHILIFQTRFWRNEMTEAYVISHRLTLPSFHISAILHMTPFASMNVNHKHSFASEQHILRVKII